MQCQYCLLRLFASARLCTLGLAVLLLHLFSPGFSADAKADHNGATARRPIVLVPGLLGSRLCRGNSNQRAEPEVVWGTLAALTEFPELKLGEDEEGGPIRSCGLIREITHLGLFTQDVYAPIIAHLTSIGYQEGSDLFLFDYDWRQSIFHNAEQLAAFVDANIPDESRRIDILAHSMGGLIARAYVVEYGGGARLGRLISAGTPFQGSVKLFQTLEEGWGTLNLLMGGIATFRETVLSFPSILELMPRYSGCCDPDGSANVSFAPGDAAFWLALNWDGIDKMTLPNLAQVSARQRRLQKVMESALPPHAEDIVLIGVDQRTPQKLGLVTKSGQAALRIRTSWAGDGTVIRESAVRPEAIVHPTSFSDHEEILSDPQIKEFIGVALTMGTDEAIRTVPVRQRSRIRTALGNLTELVGVAVVPTRPILLTGESSTVHVHVRLGERESLSPEKVRLTVRRPDGSEVPVGLRPNPAASDPTNPFEQSFSGEFDPGPVQGEAVLIATLLTEGGLTREQSHAVPVLRPF